jgi:hypothetical protein
MHYHSSTQLPVLPTLAQRLLPDRYHRLSIAVFFAAVLTLGFGVLRDFSVPSDEELQRMTGEISLLYIVQKLPVKLQQQLLPPRAVAIIKQKGANMQLHHYRDRDYGVAFELPAVAIEQLLNIRELRTMFLLRHALNFLVCWGGFIAFYKLAARRFNNWRAGLLGTLFLVLSPRLFADNFYNSKDAVFLACFTVAVAAAVPFIERPTGRRALWCALACALAIDVRLMGVLVPAATLAFISWRALGRQYQASAWHLLATSSLFSAALVGLVILGWPFLWDAPLDNFLVAWRNMSHFRWFGTVLYQGHPVVASMLPWHYAPVWIGLTVPLLYLVFFGLGASVILVAAVKRYRQFFSGAEWQDAFYLGLALVPIAAVIILHSVLYNGWRQLYFIYPMLLLVALRGLIAAWHWRPFSSFSQHYWQPALALGVAASLSLIAVRMVRLHPLETVYFNALAPSQVERYYETDYWSMSQKSGLSWLLQHDNRPKIRVFSNTMYSVVLGRQMLPPVDQRRIEVASSGAMADYYFDIFAYPQPSPYRHPLHTLWADNVRLMDIYQLTTASTPAPRAASRANE